MVISGLVRMAKDGEMKTLQSGKRLMSLVFAFDSGWGDSKTTTWCEGVMFGDRGEKICQYIQKGNQIFITGDNVTVESYQGKSGIQSKLKMNVINVELVAKAQQPQQPQQARREQDIQKDYDNSMEGFSDDVPF